MAYFKELSDPTCQRCLKKATVEVFNFRNASHGKFCRTHGYAEVARLRKEEARPMTEGREDAQHSA